MGLKTTNYKKQSGVILATAYARIEKIEVGRVFSTAEFRINESREALDKNGADEVKYFTFRTDLTKNQYEVAYAEAKKPYKRKVWVDVEKEGVVDFNPETGEEIIGTYIEKELQEKEFPNIFTGWEDDIVE